ncbi:hypothetical protein ACHAPQ_008680 [Fusarium lateritium]
MASKTSPLATDTPSAMTTEKPSSGFLKLMAFLDLIVKLAATGALFGILVLLLQLNNKFDNMSSSSRALRVQISDANPLQIVPAYSSQFQVQMTNGQSNPVWFKADT